MAASVALTCSRAVFIAALATIGVWLFWCAVGGAAGVEPMAGWCSCWGAPKQLHS